jgi:hypothetical protein
MAKQFIVRLRKNGKIVANSQVVSIEGLGESNVSNQDFTDRLLRAEFSSVEGDATVRKIISSPGWTLTCTNPTVDGGIHFNFSWSTTKKIVDAVSWYAVYPDTNILYSGKSLISSGEMFNLFTPGISGSFAVETTPVGSTQQFQIVLFYGSLSKGTFLARSETVTVLPIKLSVTSPSPLLEQTQVIVTAKGAPNEVVTYTGAAGNGTFTLDYKGEAYYAITSGGLSRNVYTWLFDGSITDNIEQIKVKVTSGKILTVVGPPEYAKGKTFSISIQGEADDDIKITPVGNQLGQPAVNIKLDSTGKATHDISKNGTLEVGYYSYVITGRLSEPAKNYVVTIKEYQLTVQGTRQALKNQPVQVKINGAPSEQVQIVRTGATALNRTLDERGNLTVDLNASKTLTSGVYTWTFDGDSTTTVPNPTHTVSIVEEFMIKVKRREGITFSNVFIQNQEINIEVEGAPNELVTVRRDSNEDTYPDVTDRYLSLNNFGFGWINLAPGTLVLGDYVWFFQGNISDNTVEYRARIVDRKLVIVYKKITNLITGDSTLSTEQPHDVAKGARALVTIEANPFEYITMKRDGRQDVRFQLNSAGLASDGDLFQGSSPDPGIYSFTFFGSYNPSRTTDYQVRVLGQPVIAGAVTREVFAKNTAGTIISSIDEGNFIVFEVKTTNILPGTLINYRLVGVNDQDLQVTTLYTGTLVVGDYGYDSATGIGYVRVEMGIRNDELTEGVEVLNFQLTDFPTVNVNVDVNDTSRSQLAVISLNDSSTQIEEGQSKIVVVNTTNVPNGRTLYYRIFKSTSGNQVTPDDFLLGSLGIEDSLLRGSFSVTTNPATGKGLGQFDIAVADDNLIDPDEYFIIQIWNTPNDSKTMIGVSAPILIVDAQSPRTDYEILTFGFLDENGGTECINAEWSTLGDIIAYEIRYTPAASNFDENNNIQVYTDSRPNNDVFEVFSFGPVPVGLQAESGIVHAFRLYATGKDNTREFRDIAVLIKHPATYLKYFIRTVNNLPAEVGEFGSLPMIIDANGYSIVFITFDMAGVINSTAYSGPLSFNTSVGRWEKTFTITAIDDRVYTGDRFVNIEVRTGSVTGSIQARKQIKVLENDANLTGWTINPVTTAFTGGSTSLQYDIRIPKSQYPAIQSGQNPSFWWWHVVPDTRTQFTGTALRLTGRNGLLSIPVSGLPDNGSTVSYLYLPDGGTIINPASVEKFQFILTSTNSITDPAVGINNLVGRSANVTVTPGGIFTPVFSPSAATVGEALQVEIQGGPPSGLNSNAPTLVQKSGSANDMFGVGYVAGSLINVTINLNASGSYIDPPATFSAAGTATFVVTYPTALAYTIGGPNPATYTISVAPATTTSTTTVLGTIIASWSSDLVNGDDILTVAINCSAAGMPGQNGFSYSIILNPTTSITAGSLTGTLNCSGPASASITLESPHTALTATVQVTKAGFATYNSPPINLGARNVSPMSATISVNKSVITETAGDNSVIFTVTIGNRRNRTVYWSVIPANNTDYVGSIAGSFNADSQSITITMAADTLTEGDENIQLGLYDSLPSSSPFAVSPQVKVVDSSKTSVLPNNPTVENQSSLNDVTIDEDIDRIAYWKFNITDTVTRTVYWKVIQGHLSPAGQSADTEASNADFVSATSGSFTTIIGTFLKTITVEAKADNITERDPEVFHFGLWLDPAMPANGEFYKSSLNFVISDKSKGLLVGLWGIDSVPSGNYTLPTSNPNYRAFNEGTTVRLSFLAGGTDVDSTKTVDYLITPATAGAIALTDFSGLNSLVGQLKLEKYLFDASSGQGYFYNYVDFTLTNDLLTEGDEEVQVELLNTNIYGLTASGLIFRIKDTSTESSASASNIIKGFGLNNYALYYELNSPVHSVELWMQDGPAVSGITYPIKFVTMTIPGSTILTEGLGASNATHTYHVDAGRWPGGQSIRYRLKVNRTSTISASGQTYTAASDSTGPNGATGVRQGGIYINADLNNGNSRKDQQINGMLPYLTIYPNAVQDWTVTYSPTITFGGVQQETQTFTIAVANGPPNGTVTYLRSKDNGPWSSPSSFTLSGSGTYTFPNNTWSTGDAGTWTYEFSFPIVVAGVNITYAPSNISAGVQVVTQTNVVSVFTPATANYNPVIAFDTADIIPIVQDDTDSNNDGINLVYVPSNAGAATPAFGLKITGGPPNEGFTLDASSNLGSLSIPSTSTYPLQTLANGTWQPGRMFSVPSSVTLNGFIDVTYTFNFQTPINRTYTNGNTRNYVVRYLQYFSNYVFNVNYGQVNWGFVYGYNEDSYTANSLANPSNGTNIQDKFYWRFTGTNNGLYNNDWSQSHPDIRFIEILFSNGAVDWPGGAELGINSYDLPLGWQSIFALPLTSFTYGSFTWSSSFYNLLRPLPFTGEVIGTKTYVLSVITNSGRRVIAHNSNGTPATRIFYYNTPSSASPYQGKLIFGIILTDPTDYSTGVFSYMYLSSTPITDDIARIVIRVKWKNWYDSTLNYDTAYDEFTAYDSNWGIVDDGFGNLSDYSLINSTPPVAGRNYNYVKSLLNIHPEEYNYYPGDIKVIYRIFVTPVSGGTWNSTAGTSPSDFERSGGTLN